MGITSYGLKQFNKITNSAFLERHMYKPARENPAKFAGRMALLSALSKDTVNCGYYTYQSYNNEKIPEENRGFVASLDLMNGILNVVGQFTLGKWIEKRTEGWFNSIIGNKLDDVHAGKIASNLQKIIKNNGAQYGLSKADADMSVAQIKQHLLDKNLVGSKSKVGKWLSVGFSAFTMLVGTQIFCKRVVTPYIATPLAGWFNNKYLKKDKDSNKNNTDYQVSASSLVKYENQMDNKSAFNSIKA